MEDDLFQLIKKCQTTDVAERVKHFNQLLPRIESMVRRFVCSFSEPDEVFQKTLIKILTHIHLFEGPPEKFWTWCRVVALNVGRDECRREEARRQRAMEAAEMFRLLSQSESSDDLRGNMAERIPHALQKLDSKCRDLLVLRYFELLPWKEIGSRFKATSDRVRIRASRCVKKLGKFLNRKVAI